MYPRGYSKENLEVAIDKYGSASENSHLGSSYFTKASLGLTELQRRTASKFGWWSLIVSILAVILSFLAVYFSYEALIESDKWRADQLQILNQIRQSLSIKQ